MIGKQRRLILFARYPAAGRVKTRLIPALGAEGAAALHRRLVLRTLRTAHVACLASDADLEIRFDGGSQSAMCHWLGDEWMVRPQTDGDLGQRMASAFDESFHEGSRATVIIGSDCPKLAPKQIADAFDALSERAAVIGPASDGGYYLVGLSRPLPELFQRLAWGTETVLADSLRVLQHAAVKPFLLDRLDDLDRPEDLPDWQRLANAEDGDLSRITVIIPALNEECHIAATLQSVLAGNPHEIIVVDGGSADRTANEARAKGAKVLSSPPGRAHQMNKGAALARGNVLLFLHADTQVPRGWPKVVSETLRRPGVAAGAFRFRIAEDFWGKSIVEWTTNFRSSWYQKPYGDQGLFLRRSVYEELGGFADLPIMEDYELGARLRQRGRLVTLPEAAITSGRRWKQLGFFRTTLINKFMVTGYHLGIPPSYLRSLYRRQSKALDLVKGGD